MFCRCMRGCQWMRFENLTVFLFSFCIHTPAVAVLGRRGKHDRNGQSRFIEYEKWFKQSTVCIFIVQTTRKERGVIKCQGYASMGKRSRKNVKGVLIMQTHAS